MSWRDAFMALWSAGVSMHKGLSMHFGHENEALSYAAMQTSHFIRSMGMWNVFIWTESTQ